MSSKKVIACETVPLSLLLNTALGWSSQQSLVQLAAGSTHVSSQNALTMGETTISHAFPFDYCHRRPDTASPTLCKAWEYTSNHSMLSMSPRTSSHVMNCPMFRMVGVGGQTSRPFTLRLHRQIVRRRLTSERAMPLALRCQRCDALIPNHFFVQNTLDHQLPPACHLPSGVNCF